MSEWRREERHSGLRARSALAFWRRKIKSGGSEAVNCRVPGHLIQSATGPRVDQSVLDCRRHRTEQPGESCWEVDSSL